MQDKEEVVYQPSVSTKTTTSKDEVKVETVYPESLQMPAYTYGSAQNSLDANLAIRNLPSAAVTPFCGTSTRTSGSTWTQAITGVGFRPSLIRIQAVYAATSGSFSDGQASSTSNEYSIYSFDNGGSLTWSFDTSKIIHLDWTSPSNATASLDSIDSDGFTLNWAAVAFNVDFMYQCFR